MGRVRESAGIMRLAPSYNVAISCYTIVEGLSQPLAESCGPASGGSMPGANSPRGSEAAGAGGLPDY